MILDYRAFDTLGESFVLFSGVTCVLILLKGLKEENTMPETLHNEYIEFNTPSLWLISSKESSRVSNNSNLFFKSNEIL